MSKGVEFPGSTVGFDTKAKTSTDMPTSGMGGKGKIDSPVANFPSGMSNTSMPKGKTPSKSIIDSPVAGNQEFSVGR